MKILSVVGTRPEAIKMAPVILELGKWSPRIVSQVCVTGQHREMLDQVLNLFGIVPDYDLEVMEIGQTPLQVAVKVMSGIESILSREQPEWVIVQGDTMTVMASALSAFYTGVKIGHVEAGLRTFDKYQPFPEEINRRLAGVVADLHFAPTEQACTNLLREGVRKESIFLTGNTVIDALRMVAEMPYHPQNGALAHIPWEKRLILVTAHRRENFGKPLEQVCLAIKEIVAMYPDVQIVYPVHLNPNVQEVVYKSLNHIPQVTLLPPLDYLPMVYLMKKSTIVLTDSGGIQEEAPGLGKPVLVLREVTERPEAVKAGTVKIVGTNVESIVGAIKRLLDDPEEYGKMARSVNPYGDGKAAERIIQLLLDKSN